VKVVAVAVWTGVTIAVVPAVVLAVSRVFLPWAVDEMVFASPDGVCSAFSSSVSVVARRWLKVLKVLFMEMAFVQGFFFSSFCFSSLLLGDVWIVCFFS